MSFSHSLLFDKLWSAARPGEASHATADEPPDTLPDGPRHHALDEPGGAAPEVHCDASLSVKEPFEALQMEPATAAEEGSAQTLLQLVPSILWYVRVHYRILWYTWSRIVHHSILYL